MIVDVPALMQRRPEFQQLSAWRCLRPVHRQGVEGLRSGFCSILRRLRAPHSPEPSTTNNCWPSRAQKIGTHVQPDEVRKRLGVVLPGNSARVCNTSGNPPRDAAKTVRTTIHRVSGGVLRIKVAFSVLFFVGPEQDLKKASMCLPSKHEQVCRLAW